MIATLHQSIQQHFHTAMDQAVHEVFQTMLGVSCTTPDNPQSTFIQDSISVLIGLAGAISGACILQTDTASSHHIASLLTGVEDTDPDVIKDALGEICNMITGAWKRSMPELAAACMLSTPTVISGKQYELHSPPQGLHMQCHYTCGRSTASFVVQCIIAEQE